MPRRSKSKSRSRSRSRSRSGGRAEWTKKVMEVYRDMKKKDSSVRLGDAMKRAAKLKREGKL
jgi:hypothetical protein